MRKADLIIVYNGGTYKGFDSKGEIFEAHGTEQVEEYYQYITENTRLEIHEDKFNTNIGWYVSGIADAIHQKLYVFRGTCRQIAEVGKNTNMVLEAFFMQLPKIISDSELDIVLNKNTVEISENIRALLLGMQKEAEKELQVQEMIENIVLKVIEKLKGEK